MSTDNGTRRDPASLTRVQITRRTSTSSDTLAHPLLSPTPSSMSVAQAANTTPNHLTGASALNNASPTRYVPYTPRHRVAAAPSAPATTSTTTQSILPAPSHQSLGTATNKLLLQNLKAAAQVELGLNNDSIGWHLLEFLANETGGNDWDDVWTLLTAEKATLLLPAESMSSSVRLNREFVKDHIAFCSLPGTTSSPLVTLSGLRGTLRPTLSNRKILPFRSILPPKSKQFVAIRASDSRSSALRSLPPLPEPLATLSKAPYPEVHIAGYTSSLPFPPRPVAPIPPPLPPRPGSSAPISRIPNPFASLFGKPTLSPTPSISSPKIIPGSPSISIQSHDSAVSEHKEPDGPTLVSAYAIEKAINYQTIGKDIGKALKAETKDLLAGMHPWVVDRVLAFTAAMYPIAKIAKARIATRTPMYSSPGLAEGGGTSSELKPTTTSKSAGRQMLADVSSSDALASSFQSFYDALEEDLHTHWAAEHSSVGKRRSSDAARRNDLAIHGAEQTEAKVREDLDRVEGVICSLFYDRIFRPSDTDDALHDDALASRIAALNMLDLGLEHLGIDMDEAPNGKRQFDKVVNACGKELQRLQNPTCHAPKAKAKVLINAHQVIVDGLSQLPPVRLKPDDEQLSAPDTPVATRTKMPSKSLTIETESVRSPTSIPTSPSLLQAPIKAFSSSSASSIMSTTSDSGSLSLAPPPIPPRPILSPAHDILSSSSASASSTAASPARSPSPSTETHPRTVVNTDVLLPFIIYSVVKANPAQLVSQLLYVQRYRSRSASGGGGEEAFCLMNLMAVVEFLENVDLAVLGLGGGAAGRVISVDTLTPIPLDVAAASSPAVGNPAARLRGKVTQQVDELTNLGTKVITEVADLPFTVLRGLLSVAQNEQVIDGTGAILASPWNAGKAGFGLLKRGTGFGMTGGGGSPAAVSIMGGGGNEEGRQLQEVSARDVDSEKAPSDSESEERSEFDHSVGVQEDEGESSGDDPLQGDIRSIRSFGSMMSGEARRDRKARMSISDRLAAKLNQPSPTSSFRGSLPPGTPERPSNGALQLDVHPHLEGDSKPRSVAPPNPRFMECRARDLRIGEVAELLEEYRRMVAAVKRLEGFAS